MELYALGLLSGEYEEGIEGFWYPGVGYGVSDGNVFMYVSWALYCLWPSTYGL